MFFETIPFRFVMVKILFLHPDMSENHRSRCGPPPLALFLATAVLASSGCALQGAYKSPNRHGVAPAAWSVGAGTVDVPGRSPTERWWSELHDPAIDRLVEVALADGPTLAEAVARVDEAQALLRANAAQSTPTVGASADVIRARQRNTSSAATEPTLLVTAVSPGLSFSWEVDLFGRIRQSVEAARSRIDARTLDAAAIRLSLAADVASGVLALRACQSAQSVLTADIASRERSLALTRRRWAAGFATAADETRERIGLASARTTWFSRQEQCALQTNALVALTGQDSSTIRALTAPSDEKTLTDPTLGFVPTVPGAAAELPAEVLSRHPAILSAQREAQAAWVDIGVARAERLPRLDVAALLTGQWLRVAGVGQHLTTWSVGPTLSGTLFDGGAGAANVSAAEARYRRAHAVLQRTLRTTVQEVENALAEQVSAEARASSAGEGVAGAQVLLATSQARWRAGAISQLELEDNRRQLTSMQDALITARRDQAHSWVALVKATGGAVTLSVQEPPHE